ncbi:MAG: hypothetical protein H7039_16055, partial [Bryobacteraceae bacterium]|nr:hypothetical protein [Bryobacteraceae bacterium]
VYTVRQPFPPENDVLLLGQVLSGMAPLDAPVTGGKNEPMLPVAWTRSYRYEEGKTGKVFTTTMGSSVDFLDAGFRRLIVNASYWALGREKKIPASGSRVDFTREYKPTPFGFNGFQKGKKPEDF